MNEWLTIQSVNSYRSSHHCSSLPNKVSGNKSEHPRGVRVGVWSGALPLPRCCGHGFQEQPRRRLLAPVSGPVFDILPLHFFPSSFSLFSFLFQSRFRFSDFFSLRLELLFSFNCFFLTFLYFRIHYLHSSGFLPSPSALIFPVFLFSLFLFYLFSFSLQFLFLTKLCSFLFSSLLSLLTLL